MILDKLTAKQKELNQNDVQFAKTLRIPRITWYHTHTGLRPLGRRVALAAMKAFPELIPDVTSFLLSDATVANKKVANVA